MNTNEGLYKTTDYSIFEMHECNRDLKEKAELERSMKQHGFMRSGAIHVTPSKTGKLKVIRGHHRLDCAKRLGLPVWYIIDKTEVDIFDLEGDGTATWNLADFATARARSGDQDCCKLLAWAKKHNMPLGHAASLMTGESAGSHNAQKLVRVGKYRCEETKHAADVAEITDALLKLGVEFAKSGLFVSAISSALRVPEFNVAHFMSNASLYPANIHRRTSTGDYLAELEALYNYDVKLSKKRIPLAFRAKEVGMNRKRSFGKKS